MVHGSRSQQAANAQMQVVREEQRFAVDLSMNQASWTDGSEVFRVMKLQIRGIQPIEGMLSSFGFIHPAKRLEKCGRR